MAANTTPIFPLSIQTSAVSFANADGTSEKTIVTAGSEGTRIDVLLVTSDDTTARVFRLLVNNGTTSFIVGEVSVPVGAGTDGATLSVKVLAASVLPWLDSSGSLFLKAGWTLKAAAKVAVTSGKTIAFVAFSGDY